MAPRYSPRKGVVTFDTFNREYWAHLPQHLTKGIGVSFFIRRYHFLNFITRASSTICGIRRFHRYSYGKFFMTTPKFLLLGLIKGSETALGLPNHVLDYETYQNLRRTYTLDYALFEAYERLKLKRGEHDPADR